MTTSPPSTQQLSLLLTYGAPDGRAKTSAPPTQNERDCRENFFTFMDLVREVRPAWLVMENVPGLLSAEQGTALETVIDTLEANGYLGGWVSCNAVDSGLPHNRDRVFFIASFRSEHAYHFFTDSSELSGDTAARESSKAQTRSDFRQVPLRNNPLVVQRRGGFGYTLAKGICPTLRAQTGGHQGGHSDRPILCGEELDVDRVGAADGVSSRLDGRRGRLIGNAVVPIISEWIGRRILEIEILEQKNMAADLFSLNHITS
jgi:DNA (cytosine-5)-methyltransferase 1